MTTQWIYRAIGLSTMSITDDHLRGDREWQPCKPMMNVKLNQGTPEIGARFTFTEDGWNSYAYLAQDVYKDAVLFKHKTGRQTSLIFKKVGGPQISLDVSAAEEGHIHCKFILLSGAEVFSGKIKASNTLDDLIRLAQRNHVTKRYFNSFDWANKQVATPWGEIITNRQFSMGFIWQTYMAHEAGSLEHAFCGCQRSKRARHVWM